MHEILSKAPTQTNKWKTLQKLILSYFHNVLHLMGQISDDDMLRLAFTETAKLVPYVTSSRKTVKAYLKVRPSPHPIHRKSNLQPTRRRA